MKKLLVAMLMVGTVAQARNGFMGNPRSVFRQVADNLTEEQNQGLGAVSIMAMSAIKEHAQAIANDERITGSRTFTKAQINQLELAIAKVFAQ